MSKTLRLERRMQLVDGGKARALTICQKWPAASASSPQMQLTSAAELRAVFCDTYPAPHVHVDRSGRSILINGKRLVKRKLLKGFLLSYTSGRIIDERRNARISCVSLSLVYKPDNSDSGSNERN